MESKIKISTSSHSEFNSRFTIGHKTYDVQTEDMGPKAFKIVTRIYSRGEIVSDRSTDYAELAGLPDFRDKLREMMEHLHRAAIEHFMQEHAGGPVSEVKATNVGQKDVEVGGGRGADGPSRGEGLHAALESAQILEEDHVRMSEGEAPAAEVASGTEKTKGEYAATLLEHLRRKDTHAALDIARTALEHYPADPFFLSYCGYLIAEVENRPKEGTMKCEEAIKILMKSKSTDKSFFFPRFYLNLGRAYLRGNRKRNAIKAFQEGLKYDARNPDLHAEIQRLGSRKSPVLPFLDRSNPINISLGKMRSKLRQQK